MRLKIFVVFVSLFILSNCGIRSKVPLKESEFNESIKRNITWHNRDSLDFSLEIVGVGDSIKLTEDQLWDMSYICLRHEYWPKEKCESITLFFTEKNGAPLKFLNPHKVNVNLIDRYFDTGQFKRPKPQGNYILIIGREEYEEVVHFTWQKE